MPISKRLRNNLIIAAITLSMIVLAGFTILYFKRESLLKAAIHKVVNTAQSKYHLNVKIGQARFSGLSTVHFSSISVVPVNRDTFARLNEVTVGVKLFPLLFGNIKIGKLDIYDSKITLVKKDSISNYDFLFKKKSDSLTTKSKANLADLGYKILHQALDKVPDDMDIENFVLRFDEDTTHIKLFVPKAIIKGGELKSSIFLNDKEAVWHVDGTVDPGDQQFNIKWYADKNKVEFPYLNDKYNLKVNFDTLQFALESAEKNKGNLEIEGSWGVKNLLINHSRISAEDVIIKDGSVAIKMIAGENFVAIDSSSTIYLGKATIHPYLKYTIFPNKIYELKLHAEEQNAQEIFNAFPIGLFESLEGIKVEGNLKYDLNLYLDSQHPIRVVFNSDLEPAAGFKILAFGKNNLHKINGPFVYTPYEKGKPVRDIIIAPENPNYTSLDKISTNIQRALLTSEDPSFYNHKGFVEESIRQSISTNYTAKSFKRGGSTISMQLVKNVFLSRQKTIARKVEEILIVWLIENQRITPKSRMYEVYLNIIEWGRNIYGIGEASRYYFGKAPADLTLGESIYLASIVPKPKSGLYAWQPDGTLKSHLHGYFNLIGRLMVKKGYTQPDSNAYGFYGVRLRESLRQQIAPQSYALPDSLSEEEGNFQGFDIFKQEQKDSVEKKISLFEKLLGTSKTDSTGKTAQQIRQEKREERRKMKL